MCVRRTKYYRHSSKQLCKTAIIWPGLYFEFQVTYLIPMSSKTEL